MRYEDLLALLRNAEKAEDVDLYREEIAGLIPEVSIMFDYDQKHTYHQYDLWQHSLHTWENLPKGNGDDMLYLAGILHDIGKPASQVKGKDPADTNMHYYGHPAKGMEIIRDRVIPGLLSKGANIPVPDQQRLLFYCEHHDDTVSENAKHLLTFIRDGVPWEIFRNLMYLEIADGIAHVQFEKVTGRIKTCTMLASENGKRLYSEITERYRQGKI